MDPIEDLLRFSRPLTEPVFKEGVKQLRDRARDPNWLFVPVPAAQRDPWQGDVLPSADLPFINADGEEVEIREGPAMVLSTTCDAVPGQDPSAILAPVYSVAEFQLATPESSRQSQVDALRSNQYARYLYLPEAGSLSERYVNFSESAAASTTYLTQLCEAANPQQRLRFSRHGWYFFSYKLGYYYARMEDEREISRGPLFTP